VSERYESTVTLDSGRLRISTARWLPPMNLNDSRAAVMAPLFSGHGQHSPFQADYRNLKNGLIYTMNSPHAVGAKESAQMDFSHADAADAELLNAILWHDRKGNSPMPPPQHKVIPEIP